MTSSPMKVIVNIAQNRRELPLTSFNEYLRFFYRLVGYFHRLKPVAGPYFHPCLCSIIEKQWNLNSADYTVLIERLIVIDQNYLGQQQTKLFYQCQNIYYIL